MIIQYPNLKYFLRRVSIFLRSPLRRPDFVIYRPPSAPPGQSNLKKPEGTAPELIYTVRFAGSVMAEIVTYCTGICKNLFNIAM